MKIDKALPVHLDAASTDALHLSVLDAKQVRIDVLRLDKIHPVISGNKWFKLKYHLAQARRNGHSTVITWGGAYSNHLVATACACHQQGFRSIGIVRGEKAAHPSATLQTAASYGMQLHFISREAYAQKCADGYARSLPENHTGVYLIPEGGAEENGICGCQEILPLTDYSAYTHILCCIGTGTMFKGLLLSKTAQQQLIGIPVLKLGPDAPLVRSLNQFGSAHGAAGSCRLLLQYHFGGYAKKSPGLLQFMNRFYERTGIPTDFVYTGKLMAACMDLVENDHFPPGSRVLVIHSGGLQGNTSLPLQTLSF